MSGANPPRSVTPNAQQDYDVTRMREEDFERLAVYIVPDMPCEKGVPGRAEKTLPRSLTLKPSLVLSTPTSTVGSATATKRLQSLDDATLTRNRGLSLSFYTCRRKEYGVRA